MNIGFTYWGVANENKFFVIKHVGKVSPESYFDPEDPCKYRITKGCVRGA